MYFFEEEMSISKNKTQFNPAQGRKRSKVDHTSPTEKYYSTCLVTNRKDIEHVHF